MSWVRVQPSDELEGELTAEAVAETTMEEDPGVDVLPDAAENDEVDAMPPLEDLEEPDLEAVDESAIIDPDAALEAEDGDLGIDPEALGGERI